MRWLSGASSRWSLLLATGLLLAVGTGCGFSEKEERPGRWLEAQETTPAQAEDGETDLLAGLLDRPAPSPEEEERVLELLDQAREDLSQERYGAVLDGLEEALALAPTLEDWGPLLEAEVLAHAGDSAAVEAALARLDPSGELHRRWGWRFRIRAAEEADDPRRALEVADRWAEEVAPGADRAAVLVEAGRILEEEDDDGGARARYLAALNEAPDAGAGHSAARALDRLGGLSGAEERMVGWALLGQGEWETGYRRLSSHLEAPELDQAHRMELRAALGEALFREGRFREAEGVLEPALDPDGGGPIPAALYWTGRSQMARGAGEAAQVTLSRLAGVHPEAPEAGRALLHLARAEEDAGRTESARGYFQELFRVGVTAPDAELASVRFGTQDYLRGSYDAATRTFDGYAAGSGRTVGFQQGTYWSALARERNGEPEAARERLWEVHEANPFSYYGILAGERLDEAIIPSHLPEGAPEAQDPGLTNRYRNARLRIEVHRRVPTPGSLAYELGRLQEHFRDLGDPALYGYAEFLIESGSPMRGILVGRDIQRRDGEWNLRLLRIVYPFPHRQAVVREARSRNLDPFFVAGLIRQESMFEADIRSVAGAVGLMQIMPATGRELARSLGVSPFSTAVLEDPEVNARLGTYFLSSLLQRFDGRVVDALAGYNAGPTRARNWRSLPTYRDTDVFIEHIPFQETRNYVKVVKQNARIYAGLYGCDDFQPCPGMSYSTYLRERAGGARGAVGITEL